VARQRRLVLLRVMIAGVFIGYCHRGPDEFSHITPFLLSSCNRSMSNGPPRDQARDQARDQQGRQQGRKQGGKQGADRGAGPSPPSPSSATRPPDHLRLPRLALTPDKERTTAGRQQPSAPLRDGLVETPRTFAPFFRFSHTRGPSRCETSCRLRRTHKSRPCTAVHHDPPLTCERPAHNAP